jgi:hypothetical protein
MFKYNYTINPSVFSGSTPSIKERWGLFGPGLTLGNCPIVLFAFWFWIACAMYADEFGLQNF